MNGYQSKRVRSKIANQSYCKHSFTGEKRTRLIHGEYILRFRKYQSTWLLRDARLKCKRHILSHITHRFFGPRFFATLVMADESWSNIMFKPVGDFLETYCGDSSLLIKEEDLNDDGQKPLTMDVTPSISVTAVARRQEQTLITKSGNQ